MTMQHTSERVLKHVISVIPSPFLEEMLVNAIDSCNTLAMTCLSKRLAWSYMLDKVYNHLKSSLRNWAALFWWYVETYMRSNGHRDRLRIKVRVLIDTLNNVHLQGWNDRENHGVLLLEIIAVMRWVDAW